MTKVGMADAQAQVQGSALPLVPAPLQAVLQAHLFP
ncbi:hypothetical protein CAEBREN_24210 [Caenorhabditis brenneri]|uniref:Uncharacterized protein n=1 Tax=Caenorhabditis brenneri TaxID=135651 RepID=G0PP34_CAEBE|nr:hypothetical protein CAEBREN_24210 [Caenorhabditis brenneri]